MIHYNGRIMGRLKVMIRFVWLITKLSTDWFTSHGTYDTLHSVTSISDYGNCRLFHFSWSSSDSFIVTDFSRNYYFVFGKLIIYSPLKLVSAHTLNQRNSSIFAIQKYNEYSWPFELILQLRSAFIWTLFLTHSFR